MEQNNQRGLIIIGAALFLGLALLGYFLRNAAITFKQFERTVTVRGLSEQEHMADVVIWPIRFTETSNDLEELYGKLEENVTKVTDFLRNSGLPREEITINTPVVTDRSAQIYGESDYRFRYVASQTVTVYSSEVERVRGIMNNMGELGKQGITISGDDYQYMTEYLFTRLNDIKPEMIEEATIEARKVAQKFAEDSDSRLGKIKTASQGQFSISPRDNNTPHIKRIRVVSTITYYLVD